MKTTRITFLCILIQSLCFSIPCIAIQDPLPVTRLSDPIHFDGMPDEPVWTTVPELPMVQLMPVFQAAPSETTIIQIAYDDQYIYLAGRLGMSNPQQITAASMKRDYFEANTDWFGLILDTFNDHENAMAFFTTPTGLRLDCTVFNDAEGDLPVNLSWDSFWDVKTVQNNRGWFAEMRIPFTTLRFQQTEDRVIMGIIVWRWIAAKSEQLVFPVISPKFGDWCAWKPSLAREIILKDIQPKNPVYLTPYVLGGLGFDHTLNDTETLYLREDDPVREGGLDLKYGLTSNLTLDMTVNTDFAQVEADNQQVNLTRFSLFFPEKRQFFQERSSNFNFSSGNDQIFYTRRIGLHEGEKVRIYGGTRIVGRSGGWDVGFLDMQTEATDQLRSENFGVLRLRRNVFNSNSYIGSIGTSRINTRGNYNIVTGIDGIFRVKRQDYFQFHWAQAFEDTLTQSLSPVESAHFGLNWEKRTVEGFGYRFDYSRSGRVFHPGIGFIMRENVSQIGTRLLYGWINSEKALMYRHSFVTTCRIYRTNGSDIETIESSVGWLGFTKNQWVGTTEINFNYENVRDSFSIYDLEIPVSTYRFISLLAALTTPVGKSFYSTVSLNGGSFYDGRRASFTTSSVWSLNSTMDLNLYYELNRITFPSKKALLAHIGRIRFLWTLSTSFSLSSFIQLNTAGHRFIANLRIRYNPSQGNDLYLVYDEGLSTNRLTETPIPPVHINRALLIKYSRTFLF